MIAMMLLCVMGCVPVDWTGMLSRDRVLTDPNPPHVITKPEFRLLIVEETADRPQLPAGQLSIFTSTALRKYLRDHCVKLSDGRDGFMIVDKDDVADLPIEFQGVHDAKNPTPWLYATDGNKGVSCPLPADVDTVLAKVKPYAEGQ